MAKDTKFAEDANGLRETIGRLGDEVRSLMKHSTFDRDSAEQNHGEMRANIMLSFRHIEDARMRLGKAIQAFQGGTSKYDKPKEDQLPGL